MASIKHSGEVGGIFKTEAAGNDCNILVCRSQPMFGYIDDVQRNQVFWRISPALRKYLRSK
jgi:hypothetical protein